MAIIRIKRNGSVTNPKLKAGELGLVGSDLHYGPWVNQDDAGSTIVVAAKNGENVFSENNTFNGGNLTLQVAANKEISFQNAAGKLTKKYFVGQDGFLRTNIEDASLTGTMLVNASYVDAKVQGLKIKTSVRVATIDNISIKTSMTAFQTQTDGVLLEAGDRVLVRKQTTASENGIYVVKSDLTLERAADFSNNDDVPSAFVFVQEGLTLADTGWVCTNDKGSVLGTSAIIWSQFSGAGTYSAEAPILKVGNEFRLGTVPIGKGGTGLTAYTKGDLVYASATNTLSKRKIGAAGTFLRSGSDGLPAWESLNLASSTSIGGVILASDTVQEVAPQAVANIDKRTYAIQLNSAGHAVVNVPWQNTNTTYEISVGDNNGEIKVTPSGGTAYNVAVKGLGSAAYTASSAYAAASHAHGNITSDGKLGSTAGLVAVTGTAGALTTMSREGIDSREFFPSKIASVTGLTAALDGKAASSHTHGNITNDGKLGSTAGLVAVTGTGGALTTMSRDSIDSREFFPSKIDLVTGLTAALNGKAASSHTHGNITNDGKIGTTAGLMIKTTTGGALDTLAAGTTSQFLRGDGTWATPVNTASAADNILKGSSSGATVTYAPYTTDVSAHASPRFYTGDPVPNSASVLKLNGQLQTKQLMTSTLLLREGTSTNWQNSISVTGKTMSFQTDSGAISMNLSYKNVSKNNYSVLTVDYVEAIVDGGLW